MVLRLLLLLLLLCLRHVVGMLRRGTIRSPVHRAQWVVIGGGNVLRVVTVVVVVARRVVTRHQIGKHAGGGAAWRTVRRAADGVRRKWLLLGVMVVVRVVRVMLRMVGVVGALSVGAVVGGKGAVIAGGSAAAVAARRRVARIGGQLKG